jgi:hypothetical protein
VDRLGRAGNVPFAIAILVVSGARDCLDAANQFAKLKLEITLQCVCFWRMLLKNSSELEDLATIESEWAI